jgi:peptide/nickel transport system substrate-binding protein
MFSILNVQYPGGASLKSGQKTSTDPFNYDEYIFRAGLTGSRGRGQHAPFRENTLLAGQTAEAGGLRMSRSTLTRRGALGALAAAAMPWDLAQAQTANGTLRVGMTLAAIPLSNGCPDQGGEGQRFMGITLYNFLVEWDLTQADRPSALKPGLATKWEIDPANPKRWWFTLRQGVRFHDGKPLVAEDVAFSFDRAFRRTAPWFDNRANAAVALRMPTIADWGTEGEDRFWLETIYPDSTAPFGTVYVGITHRGAWEAAGKSWDAYLNKPVGTGPWKLESFAIRERAVLVRNADHWEHPAAARSTSSRRRRRMPWPRCKRPASPR